MLVSNKKRDIFEDSCVIIRKHLTDKNTKTNHRIHLNDGHEIYLFLEGDVSFNIEGSIYKLAPNDLLLISNQEIHRAIVNKEVPHERMYIYFDPDYIDRFIGNKIYSLLQMFEERKNGFANKISGKYVEQYNLRKYFDDIYMWSKSDQPEKEIMMVSILLQLIVKINTIYTINQEVDGSIEEDVQYNDKIYEIIRYISQNLDKKISLDELEKKFFIDKYYLCHLFKEVTGYTLVDYMNYKKVLSAKEQLRAGRPISEVWIQFGFLNYSSFYRTFKKISGMSPSEYSSDAMEKSDRLKQDRYHREKADLK